MFLNNAVQKSLFFLKSAKPENLTSSLHCQHPYKVIQTVMGK